MTARDEGMRELAMPDMERRIANCVRFGQVLAVDHATKRVRVKSGEIETTWLPWSAGRAAPGKRKWDAPEVGEQVIVLSPTGDLRQAGVIPGFYQADYDAPNTNPNKDTTVYGDGTVIEYDRGSHTLTVDIENVSIIADRTKIELTVAGIKMLMTSAGTVFTGPVTVNGPLTYTQGLTGSGGTGAEMNGDFRVTGSVFTHNGKNVGSTHQHRDVLPGGSNTGAPV